MEIANALLQQLPNFFFLCEGFQPEELFAKYGVELVKKEVDGCHYHRIKAIKIEALRPELIPQVLNEMRRYDVSVERKCSQDHIYVHLKLS